MQLVPAAFHFNASVVKRAATGTFRFCANDCESPTIRLFQLICGKHRTNIVYGRLSHGWWRVVSILMCSSTHHLASYYLLMLLNTTGMKSPSRPDTISHFKTDKNLDDIDPLMIRELICRHPELHAGPLVNDAVPQRLAMQLKRLPGL